jgi:hypothetical protein
MFENTPMSIVSADAIGKSQPPSTDTRRLEIGLRSSPKTPWSLEPPTQLGQGPSRHDSLIYSQKLFRNTSELRDLMAFIHKKRVVSCRLSAANYLFPS